MQSYVHAPHEPIAIIGSGCRFPGNASSLSKLWDLLASPKDVSKKVPDRSFNPDGFYHPDGEHHGASNVTKSYFLEEDPRLFDSVFFNISPREAEAIDPQQRLLLETVYEAMESSGLTLKQLQGSMTSAYVGIMTTDYTDTHARDTEFFSQYQATGTSRALASNRLSYFFDWKGPSMTVDTACSSSLTAIHLALQSLRSGESKIACAAGANLLLGPDLFIGATSLHMISPSGKSQMWDAGADGYARGEGIAAVFLKTLSQALRDGDRIEALIRETGVNSDGRTQGITLPSPEAQARLIRSTYERAGLDISNPQHRPQYFEAHGTGTQAGDPREASAIQQAFFPEEEPGSKLLVGSIKTIIGHTEGCAGIAGVLKAVLAMKNRTVPPNQHLKSLNPKVAESYINLMVPQEAHPWPQVAEGHPLRSSVNSFGFGGTNSHAILETYVPAIHDNGPWGIKSASTGPPAGSVTAEGADFTPIPLVLSANSDETLVQLARTYADLLGKDNKACPPLTDMACTLLERRTVLPQRVIISGASRAQILHNLHNKIDMALEAPGRSLGQRITDNPKAGRRVLGVFTGQGAQWPQMGRHLMLRSPVFRNTIRWLEESLALLPDPPAWSLEAELMAEPGQSRLGEAALSQPLCTAVQVALVEVLGQAGIRFDTVVGHSSGEIAAAFAAGRISPTDAIRIAYYRGVHARLAGGMDGQAGSMIAVGFGLEEAQSFCSGLDGRLAVAASNSPGSVTLSGDADAVHEAKVQLDERGLFNRVLQVDTAYHSHHMAACAEVYVESLLACNIQVYPPRSDCAWVSSVYGSSRVPDETEVKATYWRDNMVQTVLFSQAVDEALDLLDPFAFAIEVGPHAALRGPALQTIKAKLGSEIPYAGVLDRKKNDIEAMSDFLGSLWISLGPSAIPNLAGYASAFFPEFRMSAPLDNLPTYPWQHDTILWRESRLSKQYRLRVDPPHELLGVRTYDDTPHEPRWRNLLKLEELPWLQHHRIQDQIIVPGAAYCIMALEAAKLLARGTQRSTTLVELHDVVIERPIVLDASSEATETLFSLRETDAAQNDKVTGLDAGHAQYVDAQFVLSAGLVEDGLMRRVCHGTIRIRMSDDNNALAMSQQYYAPRHNLRPMDIDRFYSTLGEVGLGYSGPFRGLVHAARELDSASGVIARHDVAESLPVHPSWLDVSFQTLFAALSAPGDDAMWTAFVPSYIRKICFSPQAGVVHTENSPSYYVDAYITETRRPTASNLATIVGDISLYNGTTGSLEIQIEDLTMTALSPSDGKNDRLMYMRTGWRQDVIAGFEVIATESRNAGLISQRRAIAQACEVVLQEYLYKIRMFQSHAQRHQKMLTDILDQFRMELGLDGRNQRVPSELTELAATAKQQFSDRTAMQVLVATGDALIKALQGQRMTRAVKSSIDGFWSQFLHETARAHENAQQVVTVLSQIVHKNPRSRILQVGIQANVDPSVVLGQLAPADTSYTVLLVGSDVIVPNAVTDLQSQAQRDARITVTPSNRDIDLHGFEKGSFDVVLLGYQEYLKTHSSLSTEECRALLRPGGYLVFGNLAHKDPVHIFAAHGLDSVNELTEPAESLVDFYSKSLRSPIHLNDVLLNQGFSGVHTIIGEEESSAVWEPGRSSLVISQATDGITDVLRAPLEASETLHYLGTDTKVAIIGGATFEVARLVRKLRSLLRTLDIHATIFSGLADQHLPTQLSNGDFDAVISFADLDAPVLKSLGKDTWKNLQIMCDSVQAIVWVTKGAQGGHDPYQTAMLGLWRTIRSENPQIALQLLDFEIGPSVDERFVVSSFVRLWLSSTVSELRDESHAFVSEFELVVKGGEVRIPRLVPDLERNNRHNSKRRVVFEAASPRHAELVITEPIRKLEHTVLYSSAAPVAFTSEHQNLQLAIVSATNTRDNTMGAALVSLNHAKSAVAKLVSATMVQELEDLNEVAVKELRLRALLDAIICKFRALAIVSMLPAQKTSVIIGVTKGLLHAIQATIANQDGKDQRRVVYLTTDPLLAQATSYFTDLNAADVVVVHAEASTRYVRSQLPWGVEHVIDISSSQDTPHDHAFAQGVKWWCPRTVLVGHAQFSDNKFPAYSCETSSLNTILETSVRYATDLLSEARSLESVHILPPDTIPLVSALFSTSGKAQRLDSVVQWSSRAPTFSPKGLTMPASPISSGGLFSPHKTYLLFGLTGQVGRSITQWLVNNGARHLVLASRRPAQDEIWQAELAAKYNATLLIEAVDITDKNALEKFRVEKLSGMPPVGGVANGAMVLSDGLFSNMTLETLHRVTRPKMEGSRNIDRIFGSNDRKEQQLDFFIMFSSLSAVIGMPSQANYAAANMYMVGLAMQRRSRGLTASVIDLGMIIGLGYITRTEGDTGNGAVETSLRRQNYMPIGERDLHEILTEAVVSGQQDAAVESEIITGLATYRKSSQQMGAQAPVWVHDPRLSHLIYTDDAGRGANATDSGKESLKSETASAGSVKQLVEVLQRYFIAYLVATLKLSEAQIGTNVPIIDFGIDSLVAVEIRSWFSSETGQDVPVLKILGGVTINQVCSLVAERMPIRTDDDLVKSKPEAEKSKPTTSKSVPIQSSTYNPAAASSVSADSSDKSSVGARTPMTSNSSKQESISEDNPKILVKSGQDVAIVRTDKLSLGEARFYIPSLYLTDKCAFNCTTSYEIDGNLDVPRLQKALERVVQRHEILRTIFTMEKDTGAAVQSVLEINEVFKPLFQTIATTSEAGIKAEIEATFAEMHNHVFDLSTGDTLRATILSHGTGTRHTIIFGYHHIVMDGVSWQSFLQDLADCYELGSSSVPPPIPDGTQYMDFAVKQAADSSSQAFAEKLQYWKSEFPEVPKPMKLLPFAQVATRRPITDYKTRTVVTHVTPEVVRRIRKVAQGLRITAFHFWLGAFQVMLAHLLQSGTEREDSVLSTKERLCIGITDANRSDQNFSKTVGYLLELLPVVFEVDMAQKFSNMLQGVRTKTYGALARSGVPFEDIVQACGGNSDPTTTPFFQVVFNYRMGATKAPELISDSGNVAKMSLLDYADATTPFDVSVSLDEKDDGSAMITLAMLDYLYDSTAVELVVDTYKHVIDTLSQDPAIVVGQVSLFSSSTVDAALRAGTGPALSPGLAMDSDSATVSRRFNRWLETDPTAIAVKDSSGMSKTYFEISKRAHAIAEALKSTSNDMVGPETLVCVMTEPSADTISCMLGIIQLGASYVPLDIRNSDERLADILDESDAQLVVFHNATRDRAMKLPKRQGVNYLNLSDVGLESSYSQPDLSQPDSPGFLLYTSGSTGKPKGIILSHANVATHVTSVTQKLGVGREIVLQQSALGFDASLCQIFLCICNGGTLIIGNNRQQDPEEIAALMEREQVTLTLCIISEMASLIRHGYDRLRRCKAWRIALCGGEVFTVQLAEAFASLELPDLQVINAYGPTEATVMATTENVEYRALKLSNNDRIPVGQAIPNYSVYVVDRNGNPLPRGFVGEIAIAGPGVALGYRNASGLTKEKFRPDTISKGPHLDKAAGNSAGYDRIYLTGDKGRLVEDDRFLILGRIGGDSQIKLRGIRIELDDIRSSILKSSEGRLSDAAVVVKGDPADAMNQYLAAFVVFAVGNGDDDEKAHSTADDQNYLRRLLRELPLPVYMRPAVAVSLKSLPVTGRGKLDTKRLASMLLTGSSLTKEPQSSEEHLSEVESKLKEIWQSILTEAGVAKEIISIKKSSDFFSVGGNSLLLMQLRVQIRDNFNGLDIPVVELFQNSILEGLATKITGMGGVVSNADDFEQENQETKTVDWQDETELGSDIKSMLRDWVDGYKAADNVLLSSSDSPEPKPVSVLLTGATGFLGKAILSDLEASPNVERIHCVAIRGENRLTVSSKIIPHKGDLGLPLLGMDETEARATISDVDVIIHNGATVSHLKSYQTLKAANVGSTKELMRLALMATQDRRDPSQWHRPIPMHFISTAGVARLPGLERVPEASVASSPPVTDGSDGYVATNWASERFLERFEDEVVSLMKVRGMDMTGGWPITIHRPSSVTLFADESAVPDTDITHSTMRYSRLLRAVPDFSQSVGVFDFVDLGTIVSNVVHDMFASLQSGWGGITYRHQSGDKVVPFSGLKDFLLEQEGQTEDQDFAVLSMEEWTKAAIQAGLDPLVGGVLAATEGKIFSPWLEREGI